MSPQPAGQVASFIMGQLRERPMPPFRLSVLRAVFLLFAGWLSPSGAEPPRIEDIVFEGNKVTQPLVLRREMLLQPGDPADPDLIERSRQAVQDLGLFRAVTVRQETSPAGIRLVFTVVEKWYLLGYPRLSANSDGQNSFGAELRWNNLWGLNHSLRVLGRSRDGRDAGRGREVSYRLGYQIPFLFDTPYGVSARVAHAETPVTEPGEYTEVIDDSELLLTRRLSRDGPASQGWSAGAGLLWKRQDTDGSGAPLPQGSATALVAQLDYRDLRDHLFSDEGVLFNTRYEIADRHHGSNYSYTRFTADYRQSLALGSIPHQTLEFGAHLGSANNGPVGTADFNLGGVAGLRGYDHKAFQGDFYYLLSAQYLRPLHWDWLRLVVGVEAGNVFREADYFNDRIHSSANIGLRLRLPRLVNFELELGVALPLTGGDMRYYGDREGL
jgi:outer membrane protein assembly factor BamA